jgi:hypothetical protein
VLDEPDLHPLGAIAVCVGRPVHEPKPGDSEAHLCTLPSDDKSAKAVPLSESHKPGMVSEVLFIQP